jgi:hypothetical protein
MRVEVLNLKPETIRVAPIIEILARDILGASLGNRIVIRRSRPETPRRKYPNPWITFCELTQQRKASVSRPVIDNYELEVAEGLSKYSRYRTVEVRLPVVHGGDNTDAGNHSLLRIRAADRRADRWTAARPARRGAGGNRLPSTRHAWAGSRDDPRLGHADEQRQDSPNALAGV